MLIPRMKNWVASYYPGTKIGITEYNWGAEGHINGATAQADILGIFGREGLDLATRWTTPAAARPLYKAMKMFRNYDGNKSTLRRHQRQRRRAEPGQRLGLCRRAVLRRRADDDGDQQAIDGRRAGRPWRLPIACPAARARSGN